MELQRARLLAQEVVEALSPYCQRIEVVGSIRRQRPFPRDIDAHYLRTGEGDSVTRMMAERAILKEKRRREQG